MRVGEEMHSWTCLFMLTSEPTELRHVKGDVRRGSLFGKMIQEEESPSDG